MQFKIIKLYVQKLIKLYVQSKVEGNYINKIIPLNLTVNLM